MLDYWLIGLVRTYFARRQEKRRRRQGLEMVSKLPPYLQDDVGMRMPTIIDQKHQKHSFY
jgi:hypothetical protein